MGLRTSPPALWGRYLRPKSHGWAVHTRRAQVKTYTVRPGDSFWSIAKGHNVDWYNLAADNHMQMYTVLKVGKVLDLPAKGEKPHKPMPLEAGGPDGPTTMPTSSPTAVTVSATSSTSAFEACVISRESGGNPQVMNASGHWGLFQFSEATWIAYGGTAAEFGNASAAVQEQVFANAMARGGESNWAPYDGC
jgi:spore germination protein YaaH